MNKLNLTQLNKQRVAEREMKNIEGGEAITARLCSGSCYPNAAFSTWEESNGCGECYGWEDPSIKQGQSMISAAYL